MFFFSKDPLPAFIELKKREIYNLTWRLKTGRQQFRSGLQESPSPPLDLRVTGYIKGWPDCAGSSRPRSRYPAKAQVRASSRIECKTWIPAMLARLGFYHAGHG
jgi:hypothetical protein